LWVINDEEEKEGTAKTLREKRPAAGLKEERK